MKMILRLITGFGFFLLIGTAGAGDMNTIDISQIASRSLFSVSLIILSIAGVKFLEMKKEEERRKRKLKRCLQSGINQLKIIDSAYNGAEIL